MSRSSGVGRKSWLRIAARVGHVGEQLSRLTGRGAGGVIGGRIVMALVPRALSQLGEGRHVTLVSGTNGKTTTTAYLATALTASGPVLSNADGANTPPGLVSALLSTGRPRAHRAVLEVDEAWLPWCTAALDRPAVVLTNLSRDQLHRHQETGRVVASWRRAMPRAGRTVANADDPAVVFAALVAPQCTWVAAGLGWSQDSVLCPACGAALRVVPGSWSCACGLSRPQPEWWLEGSDLVNSERRIQLELALPGRANLANAALAVVAAADVGIDPGETAARLSGIRSVAGRYEVVEHEGRRARLVLAKNPASWSEVLSVLADSTSPVVMAFNCDGVDGRDPSWLYDVDFTRLADRQVVVTGRRAVDLLARLHIDELPDVARATDVRDALRQLPIGEVDVVANYTAFQEARRELAHAS